jgi:hypothetical protein
MDLVTLVTACALGAEPKLMHALIWHQSAGEPWAISVRNEPMPRVYSSMQEAITETRAASGGIARVGLAGVPIPPSKANPAMFLPCRNVAIAGQRIARLADRCKTHPHLKGDRTSCAVAVYRGSWARPDVKFAEAVAATVARGDAPNFDMPKDTSIELLDVDSDTTQSPNDPSLGSVPAPDQRAQGWSSGLFPPKPKPAGSGSNDAPNDGPPAEDMQSSSVSNAAPSTAKSALDSFFVPRSSDRRPQ